MKFFKKTSIISCYHFSSSVPHSTDLFGSVTLSAVTGGSCRSLASTVPVLFRYPFGAPLRSHLLYLSVPFLSAIRNVLCRTSMINTLFLIAFAYSYSSTGNVPCQCSFVLLFSQDQDRVSRKRDFCTGALRGLFSGIKFSQQYQIFRCRLSYGKSGQIYCYSLSRGISQQ